MRPDFDRPGQSRGGVLLAVAILFFPLTGGVLAVAGVGSTEAAVGDSLAPSDAVVGGENHSAVREAPLVVVADATPESFQIVSSGPIKAEGLIVSTSGGFQFPDGTVQSTAAVPKSSPGLDAVARAGRARQAGIGVVVAGHGGDHATLGAALASLTDAGPARPYVIHLGPGVYRERVRMRPYVSIQGAGAGMTRIVAEGGAEDEATVVAAPHASLRNLTVENTGKAAFAVAVRSPSGALTLEGVRAAASGGRRGNFAIVNEAGALTLRHVVAEAVGGSEAIGVRNDGLSPVSLTDVSVRVSDAAKQGIGISDRGGADSRLRLAGVDVEVSGAGSFNTGIHCHGTGDLFLEGVRVRAAGADVINEAVFIGPAAGRGTEPVAISGLWARASGGEVSRGATLEARSVILRGSHLEARGARNNTGLMVPEGIATGERHVVRLLGSSVIAADQTVWSEAEDVRVAVGHSTLEGGAVFVALGQVACAATIDEELVFHSQGCP